MLPVFKQTEKDKKKVWESFSRCLYPLNLVCHQFHYSAAQKMWPVQLHGLLHGVTP